MAVKMDNGKAVTDMNPAEWIALCAFGLTIVSLLGSGVWILATMRTSINVLIRDQKDLSALVHKHSESCDHDRMDLTIRLGQLERP